MLDYVLLCKVNSSDCAAWFEDFHRIFAVQNSGSGVYSTRVLQFKTFSAEDFFFKEVLQFKVVVVENFLLECNSLMSSLITNGEQVFI